MSVSTIYQSKVTTTETLGDAYLSVGQKAVLHNGLDTTATYNSGSGVPATKVVSNILTLSSGAATLDMRVLVGTNGAATDLNGLKVQLIKLRGVSGNANNITVVPGASNGYTLLGSSSNVTLYPGGEVLFFANEHAPDVDSTHKTLDFAGTGSQQVEYTIVAG